MAISGRIANGAITNQKQATCHSSHGRQELLLTMIVEKQLWQRLSCLADTHVCFLQIEHSPSTMFDFSIRFNLSPLDVNGSLVNHLGQQSVGPISKLVIPTGCESISSIAYMCHPQ